MQSSGERAELVDEFDSDETEEADSESTDSRYGLCCSGQIQCAQRWYRDELVNASRSMGCHGKRTPQTLWS